MQLTNKQEEGLKIAVERYKVGMPYTCISGYAGSGKSTLVKFIVAALNIPDEKVAYVAYTGKAANVLKNKGCPNATTAHKLIYYPRQLPNGSFVFKPKPFLVNENNERYKLIVVDEVSMLPADMWFLLLSYGIYILATGDPGQLGPIQKDGDEDQCNHVLDSPHVFLDEIMRQAQESAIIRLSMHIREGKDFRTFPTVSGEVRIIPSRWNFPDENDTCLQASQIICGTNARRIDLNSKIRSLKGYGPEPTIEDKIIGLTNHWDCVSIQGNALTNGAIGNIVEYEPKKLQTYPERLKIKPTELMYTNMFTEDEDIFDNLPIDYQCLKTGKPSLTPREEYQLRGYIKSMMLKGTPEDLKRLPAMPYQFNYGYAITCWKAQGSEWPYVLGYDATWLLKKSKEEYTRYMYTLVTRASKAVILVGE